MRCGRTRHPQQQEVKLNNHGKTSQSLLGAGGGLDIDQNVRDGLVDTLADRRDRGQKINLTNLS